MNCPRCGFTQPQDQYCAQCGVDMLKFRPPKIPLAKRIANNAVLQISLVLLIAGGAGYSLYQKRHSDLQDRVRYLKGAQVVHSEGASGAASDGSASSVADAMPAELLNDSGSGLQQASSVGGGGAGLAGAGTKAATAADATKKPDPAAGAAARAPMTLNMVFAEVPQSALMQIYEVSRTTGQFNSFGNFVAGILPDIDRRLSGGSSGVRVLGRETRSIDSQHPVQFFQGIHLGEPENELGFSYYIEVTDGENDSVRGNVEVSRSWREPQGPNQPLVLTKTTFPAVFELGPSAGFFMARLLQPTTVTGGDTDILSLSPFQIMRSNAFRGGQSEYVLFLTFERPRAAGAGSGTGSSGGTGAAAGGGAGGGSGGGIGQGTDAGAAAAGRASSGAGGSAGAGTGAGAVGSGGGIGQGDDDDADSRSRSGARPGARANQDANEGSVKGSTGGSAPE